MALVLLLFTTLFVAFIVYPFLKIGQNYQQARKLDLPILVTPFAPLNPFWGLTQQFLAPIFCYLSANLPSPLCHIFDFVHYSTIDWNFDARYTTQALPFKLYSPAFLIVSTRETQLIISDPVATDDILSRIRKDFIKAKEMYGPLEIFGPNIDTLNGDEWARHRRITAPPFNERNSGFVWKESLRQANGMLRSWTEKKGKPVLNTSNDTLELALHVLTAAGFGKTYEFGSGVQEVSPGHTLSYRDALKTVLRHLIAAIITSALPLALPSFMLPRKARDIKRAVVEFKQYMAEMVEEERMTVKNREREKDNLMSALLRSSQPELDGKGRNVLSDEEIFGNLFIYNFAGHDTTANTLAYAINMLAADPKYQDWIGEEVDAVFNGRDDVQDWEYEKAFPKLKRCLALQYETLRLYGPVIFLPKFTQDSSQPLTIGSKTYLIPPRTYVIINVSALHTNPAYWGADSLEFRPERFIISSSLGEELLQPPAANYIPWASGPRVCPGKKFAQVEFTAVVAKLFMKHRVSPKLEVGETREMAAERVKRCVLDSGITLTFSMKHPERVQLLWEEKA